MSKCEHKVIMKRLCCECGVCLTDEEFYRLPSFGGVSVVHSFPDLLVCEEVAMELGEKDRDRLTGTRKLSLVLDLDHTLVHCSGAHSGGATVSDSSDVSTHSLRLGTSETKIAVRPGACEFIRKIAQWFELHVFTLGTREYARKVVDIIDPDKKLIHDRIRSRCDSTFSYSKEAEFYKIFPVGSNMVCILDDRCDVWGGLPNVIQILPFFHFLESEDVKNSPCLNRTFTIDTITSITKYSSGAYFEHIIRRLQTLHKMFYDCLDCQHSDTCDCHRFLTEDGLPDVKKILTFNHKNVLKSCKLVLSGIVPLDDEVEDTTEYAIARYLGAVVVSEIEDGVTHVITVGVESHKVRRATASDSILVVHVNWLYCCYYLATRVEEASFPFVIPQKKCDSSAADFIDNFPAYKRSRPGLELDSLYNEEYEEAANYYYEREHFRFNTDIRMEDFLEDETLVEALKDLGSDSDEGGTASQPDSDRNSNEASDDLSKKTKDNDYLCDMDSEELDEYVSKLDKALS